MEENPDNEEPVVCPQCGNENYIELMHLTISQGMLTSAFRIMNVEEDEDLMTDFAIPVGQDLDAEVDEAASRLVNLMLDRVKQRFIFDMQMGAN